MKTIDELIEAQARCLKYPNCHFCFLHAGPLCTWIRDVLEYLKAYREDKDDLTALRAFWAEQQENEPLTWGELKSMEGKPVWVEEENQPSQWYLIDEVETDEDDDPEFVSMNVYDCQGDYWFYKNNIGTKWKAYRRERK